MSILDGARSETAPRRHGRTLAVLLIVFLLFLGLTVAADRVAAAAVERGVSQAVGSSLDADGVATSITGFPFLTQALRGELERIDVSADTAILGAIGLRTLEATATGIEFSLSGREVTGIRHLDASAELSTAVLRDLIAREIADLDITLISHNDAIVAQVAVIGDITIDVELAPRAADGRIAVDIVSLSTLGLEVATDDLPTPIRDRLLGLRIDVPGVPAGITITAIDVVDTGVLVTLEGIDLDPSTLR